MARPLEDAIIAALRQHPPFDQMGSKSLRLLASRLQLAYYPRGAAIVSPENGVAQRLHILKQGHVRGAAGGVPGAVDVMLGAGECFPLGAMVGNRATVYAYRADEDCFCWELAAEDFHKLLKRSARFHSFCTSQLAMLVEHSQRAVRVEASDVVAGGMLRHLREVISRTPVSCKPETPLREVLKSMHDQRVGSMIVVDKRDVPQGIFTGLDVLKRVAIPQLNIESPISAVMSKGVITLEEEAPIVDAALAMVKHGIRHVVVTRDGRLAGVISERDLFGMQRTSLRRIIERVKAAATVPQLSEAAADVRALARALLAQGVAAEQLTQMTCALNDSITQRLIELAAPKHGLRGHWCWMALGSEGRLDQTLATDQDNALIFTTEGDVAAARTAFLRFAQEVNLALDACGFPLCKGEIMARNPKWCLSLEEWRAVFAAWIRNPEPEALLNATIFFDFRALAGEAKLVGELRTAVLQAAAGNPLFRRAMVENALRSKPPLGLLRDFSPDDSGAFPGTLDLKAYGARPITDGARILALAHRLPATSTAARLRGAAAAGALPQGEAAAIVDAFHYIQMLRLRRQYLESGLEPGSENRIDPARLNAIDRRILKEAFRQATMLQERLRLDYEL